LANDRDDCGGHSSSFRCLLPRGAHVHTALGPAIAAFLEDPSIVEVVLDPDGRRWIDRPSGGVSGSG
jgi:hypothetical protein